MSNIYRGVQRKIRRGLKEKTIVALSHATKLQRLRMGLPEEDDEDKEREERRITEEQMSREKNAKENARQAQLGNVVMQAGGLDGRLPVFVFPPSLTFYLDDQSTHKQIVTLYNPYDFHMGYNILCNAPKRYMVDCPRGVIRPKCSLDIVVSHTDVNPSNVQAPDKLRFHIQEDGRSAILGRKDVSAQLVRGVPDPRGGSDTDRFESVQGSEHAAVGGYPADRQRPNIQRQQEFGSSQGREGPSLILVSAAIVCILGLFMPTEGDLAQSVIPTYLHLSANFKMVISFALGMITLSILKAG